MATLTIASKANQATTLPILLVASLVNESNPDVTISFKFEDVEVLGASNSVVELTTGDGSSIFGPTDCLEKLVQDHPFLAEKHDARVS